MSSLKLSLQHLKNQKPTMVVYSSRSLWWTHSTDDMTEAINAGILQSKKNLERFLNDPSKSEEDKKRLSALNQSLFQNRSTHQLPTDPWGAPLFQVEADKWIKPAEEKPEHFKKYGIEAFMKTHHQNCKLCDEYVMFTTWEQVTEYLDGYYRVKKYKDEIK